MTIAALMLISGALLTLCGSFTLLFGNGSITRSQCIVTQLAGGLMMAASYLYYYYGVLAP
ncbi:MAG: hypothetical protein EOP83_04700 [Verrucomicrobiaceae bacterium]|nr:MAG: hypothetical protein EOP83_04700 [Verrucomicrobiaceae bacterium]